MKRKKRTLQPLLKKYPYLLSPLIGLLLGLTIASSLFNHYEPHALEKAPQVRFSPENAQVNSPQNSIEAFIVDQINHATTSIHMSMFSFTSQLIYQALLQAQKRGVNVCIMADHNQSLGKKSKVPHCVKHIKATYLAPKGKTFHHKFYILDEQITITGSANATPRGNKKNRENIIWLYDKNTAQYYTKKAMNYRNRPDFVLYGHLTK